MGQGDVLTLLPAITLVSGQFHMLRSICPSSQLRVGAAVDDRDFRGPINIILEAYDLINKYDELAGQRLQHEKSTFGATHDQDQDKKTLANVDLH